MFKQQKENQYLTAQSLDFLSRQMTYLTNIAQKINQFQPQIVADQILECAQLIEKKILHSVQNKRNQQFHDYVSDFYQSKMEQLRRELNQVIGKNRGLEAKVKEMEGYVRRKDEELVRSQPFDLGVVNQNMSLKNELLHSQRLIAQNQQIAEAQNILISQLKGCLLQAEQRQNQFKLKYEEKIRQLDDAINSKKKKITELIKQFEGQNKRMDREFRELQLQNISLVQQKDSLESEVILKSQEIKLLGKKIYDLNMMVGKYQRQVQFSSGILQEEKMGLNRMTDQNRSLRDKLRQLERQYEQRLELKFKQIKQLSEKIVNLNNQNKQMSQNYSKNGHLTEKYQVDIKAKKQEIGRLEQENGQLQHRLREYEKQIKKLEKKDKQNLTIVKELEQVVQQKDEEIHKSKEQTFKLKKQLDSCTNAHESQKKEIKKNIEQQFLHLIKLNQQMLSSLQKTQAQSKTLQTQLHTLQQKNTNLNNNIEQMSFSFDQAKKMLNKLQQEKDDLTYIKEQLQIKLKHTQRKCEEINKISEERQVLGRKTIQLEEIQHQSKKLLREKENQIEKYKKIIKEDSKNKASTQAQTIKILKEEACKKEFMLRQANSKLNEAQAELRQLTKKFDLEREAMKRQIHEMEKIIQDNFDHSSGSNRLIDSTIA